MQNLLQKIKSYFSKGHERSVKAKKNIIGMIFLKGASILISLLLVPMTIHYVDSATYGLWLTISSIVTWIGFFDIGLNNGLKNKFAEAKALGEDELAQRYVSTTYAVLSLIFIPTFVIFALVNQFVDWTSVFNVDASLAYSISASMLIVVGFFSFKFILSTINVIITADQKPAEASLRSLIEHVISLVVIYLLTLFTKGSLVNLCLALCVAPLIVLIFFNFSLFAGRYKKYRPVIRKVDFSLLPDLLKLGVQFFVIQIAMIVQFQATNLIIMRSFGAEEVTLYNVTYKYFHILAMLITIFLAPVWSAVTEAKAKGDNQWIINVVNKYRQFTWLLVGLGLVMLLCSEFVFDIWLGGTEIETSFTLSFVMFLYMLTFIIGRVEGTVLNGLGYLRVQMVSSAMSPVIFLVLIYLFINNFNLGIYSVLIAGIISNYNGYVLAPIQYMKVCKYRRKGIWVK